jgi:hypothetical protein
MLVDVVKCMKPPQVLITAAIGPKAIYGANCRRAESSEERVIAQLLILVHRLGLMDRKVNAMRMYEVRCGVAARKLKREMVQRASKIVKHIAKETRDLGRYLPD